LKGLKELVGMFIDEKYSLKMQNPHRKLNNFPLIPRTFLDPSDQKSRM
jgi:hypothetical protein